LKVRVPDETSVLVRPKIFECRDVLSCMRRQRAKKIESRWDERDVLIFDNERRRLECLNSGKDNGKAINAYPGDGGLAKSSKQKLKERLG